MSKRRTTPDIPEGPVSTTFATAEIVRDPSRPSHLTLLLDGVESSALDLDDPAYLEFEYMQHISVLLDTKLGDNTDRHPRILHLGGAACALARSLAARHNVHQVAVEIDAELARLVRTWFPLPSAPFLKIRVDDARRVLDSTSAAWQCVVRDAFANQNVPLPLVTAECAQRAALVIPSTGAYVVNSVASAGPRRLDEDVAAIAQAFEHIIAIADPAIFNGKRFGNVVIGGSHTPWDEASINRSVRALPLLARTYSDTELRKRAASVRPLTDFEASWPPPVQIS